MEGKAVLADSPELVEHQDCGEAVATWREKK